MQQSKSVPCSVREAVESDIDELIGLLAILFLQEVEFAPDSARQRRGLARILCTPSLGTILVAVHSHRVVGMVNLLYTESTALGGRVALLEDMVVLPELRGQGVGSALLNAAISRCRVEQCRRITLLTDQHNSAAQCFYSTAGFSRSTMAVFRCQLPETDYGSGK